MYWPSMNGLIIPFPQRGAVRVVASRSGDVSKAIETLEAKAAQEHLILTEDQVRAPERAREDKVAHG
jgi:hypothetical protein